MKSVAKISGVDIPTDQRKFIYTAFFLVWPFGSLIAALKFYREPLAKNIFWLFCIFFGFTFIQDPTEQADSARYVELFNQYSSSNMNFSDLLNNLYSENTSQLDIAQPLITFAVTKCTRNPAFLFATFAFIFGFFYSRNLWYIMDRIPGKKSLLLAVFLVVIALLNPIWNISNFRFFTAFHIFLYGALPFLLEGKKKSLIWVMFSVLVHFTFIIPVFLIIGFSFLPKKITIFFWLFILTSFVKEINLLFVRDLLYLLPDVFYFRVQSYTNLDYADKIASSASFTNWYVGLSGKVVIWTAYAFIIYIYITGRSLLKQNRYLLNLFCFALFMFAFANVSSLVPSGHRFLVVANMFMFASFVLYFASYPETPFLKLLKFAMLPLLLLFIVVSVRVGMDTMGLFTLIGNPILAFVMDDPMPLIDYLK